MLFTECDLRHSVNAIELMIQLLSVVDKTCAASFLQRRTDKTCCVDRLLGLVKGQIEQQTQVSLRLDFMQSHLNFLFQNPQFVFRPESSWATWRASSCSRHSACRRPLDLRACGMIESRWSRWLAGFLGVMWRRGWHSWRRRRQPPCRSPWRRP